MAYCSGCGSSIEANTKFCAKCGTATPANGQATTTATVQANMGDQFNQTPETKPWLPTFLLCWFLGAFGGHRFYVGKTGSALGMLFTLGGCGIWTLIDWITLLNQKFTDNNGVRLMKKPGDNKIVWIMVSIVAALTIAYFVVWAIIGAAMVGAAIQQAS